FVTPKERQGLFPLLLQGLLRQRKATKEALLHEKDPACREALECRQLALKACANASYGFTGSDASPLQCTALSESCLR
ncbi:unnamed protein product, partial [Discosporangium mesarthrocarpum]